MKSQSFESRLRHAIAPAADPQAKARAKRAALEEFERVYAVERSAAGEVDVASAANAESVSDTSQEMKAAAATDTSQAMNATPTTGAERSAHAANAMSAATARKPHAGVLERVLNRWLPARPAMLGGLATACVAVIGVSVYWLLPAQEREIKLHRTSTDVTLPVPEGATTGTAQSENAASPTMSSVGPSTPAATDETASTPAEGSSARAEQPRSAPTQPAQTSQTTQPSQAAQPSQTAQASQPSQPSRAAQTSQTSQPPSASTPPQPKSEASTATSISQDTAIVDVTDRPVPRAPPPPPPAPNSSDEVSEVAVTASQPERRAFESASPIVTLGSTANAASGSSSELQEVVTATQKMSRRERQAREKAVRLSSSVPVRPVVPQEASGGDKFKHFEVNPVKRVADAPVSTFSVDVDTTSYSFIRRQLNIGVMPPVDSVRVEEMINYFDYAWPTPDSRDQPFKPTITVSDSPWGEGKKLIHVGIKGYALPVDQQPDVNLVLLLDVSGSMDSPDKLPLAQQSMALLLDSLKPTDTVGIVVYAGAAGMVLPPTPVREKDTILQALNSLRPGGSTAGAAGIKLAYELAEKNFRKNGVNRILLATDGDFNVGISNENELKGFVQREREKGVFLSVLGFGLGNYQDETAQVLAQNGNGAAAYIDSLSEAKKVLVQQSTGSLFTIAKDVKLQVEFNPATVSEYRLVGYETRALNREDFNNDKVDAGDVGAGHTVTAIYEITPVGSGAELIGERRYAAQEDEKPSAARRGKSNEYGFLKIRYKLPNGFRSRLMEQPILVDAGVPASLRKEVEFSTAVAGFGQLLRGGAYTGSLNYEEVMQQAEDGLSQDPHGYRREFMELVRKVGRMKEGR